uniref:MAM domain containing 4 n=1 Tax=Zonotrichia albicollis TaxID=44394 RepID=A0A8D2MTD5_ZONAL
MAAGGRAMLALLVLLARTVLPSGSVVVNSCSSAAEQLCNFVCDCSDCSDENQCGYLWGSAVLGTPFTCDFEDSDCGWQDVGTSTYGWVRGRASLAKWGMGPHSDHTVGTDLGWFLVTMSPPAKTTATAWLRSPEMREAAATCEIRAWYHLSGRCESTQGLNQTERPVLRLAVAHRDGVVELWQSPEHSRVGWHPLVAYSGRIVEQFQLIFSLTQPPTCGAEVALDDIMFRNCGLPENFTCCSFDYDLCGWEMAAGPPVWGRNTSLNLGTSYSIPTRDHSNNSRAGFFLHVSSDPTAQAGGTAQLSSPTFQATNSCSLVLYCHLHGSATSTLSISYVTNSTKHLMREKTGDLGSCWVRERVDFNVADPFKVLIEGLAGSGGTVAVDDLILSQGCVKEQEKPLVTLPSQARASPCAADEVACDSGGCIAAELACDFAHTCADGSDEERCGTTNFESGAGGWHDVSVGRLRWALQKVTESDIFLTGTFLALQTGEGQMVGPAKARSPLLGPSGPACTMEMSYHIHSDPQGFLAINVADHTTGSTQLVWQTQGRGSTTRGHVRVPLGERSRPFQVELLALVDLQGSASVGVDNVTFEQCYHDVVTPTAAELSCNFERGMCGWYQDLSSDFKWVHSTGQGQGSDHTTGSGKGLVALWGNPGHPITFHSQGQGMPWTLPAAPCLQSKLTYGRLGAPRSGLWVMQNTHTMTPPPWLSPTFRLLLVRGCLCAMEPRAAGAAPQLPPGAGRCPSLSVLLVPPGGPTNRYVPHGILPGPPQPASALRTAGSPRAVGWLPPCPPLPRYPEPQAVARGRRGGGAVDPPRNPGQHLAPGTGDTALHGPAAVPGEERPRAPLAPAGHSVSDTAAWGQVAFEVLHDGFLGDVGLDDITQTAGPCGAELSCSFEVEGCGLAASGEGTWQRQSNGTGTTAGPVADHTTGTAAGHYMVVNTGRVSLPAGHTAALTSQPYQPSVSAQCLAFWYQLSPGTPGSLRVFVEQSRVRRKVLSVSTMEGSSWHRSHVTVQPDGDWQVVFEAVGAGGDHGYIALDDLHVSEGACPKPASCDFEQDTCGWSSPLDPRLHSLAWGWKSGVTLAKYPGPEQDHTLGTRNGHYMHFDTSVLGARGTSALLESPPLPAATDSCLRFWYHMDIPEHLSSGELRVALRGAGGQRTVWSVPGHRGRGWRGAAVPVQSPGEFQISFEITTRRWPMEGTVALDDIMYSARVGCHSSPESPVEEKPSGSFVAEVALSVLLALVIVALGAAGGWCWLKQQRLASRTPTENNSSQGFDNITFRDDKVIISPREGD